MGISTHILDTMRGRPAPNVRVALQRVDGALVIELSAQPTDTDGRVKALWPAGKPLEAGSYRLVFEVGAYFTAIDVEAFYPRVTIDFVVKNPAEHFHVPLLLTAFGYSTYRGS